MSKTLTINKFPEPEHLRLVSKECLFSLNYKEDTGLTLISSETSALEFSKETLWAKTAQIISLVRHPSREEDMFSQPRNKDHLPRSRPLPSTTNKFNLSSTSKLRKKTSEEMLLFNNKLLLKRLNKLPRMCNVDLT